LEVPYLLLGTQAGAGVGFLIAGIPGLLVGGVVGFITSLAVFNIVHRRRGKVVHRLNKKSGGH